MYCKLNTYTLYAILRSLDTAAPAAAGTAQLASCDVYGIRHRPNTGGATCLRLLV